MYEANQRPARIDAAPRRGRRQHRKLFRQKRHRQRRVGPRRTNKRKGGAPPRAQARDYEYHMPKKAVRIGDPHGDPEQAPGHEVVIIDDLKLDAIKTREVAAILRALKLEGLSCLVGTVDYYMTLYRSARNIQGVEVQPTSQFNT